ncbi:UbiD family decarboxylase [Agrobacterium vitis]|nr:UbiD family decarboxylase [Agrobacterium vitis]MCM2470775.1 UbiD family decarboxylase [Agrobacterium vitis]MUO71275.1 UbiD family decarboxylase [Agrobacterium vitis]MUO84261.1 UbiD family decarboxylase [Agrobacterium vitis]MVA37334.1 UbiD family decarboxylase [Agrobacterium vitis]
MRDQSCRTMMAALQKQGEFLIVDEEIDPVYDLSALLSLTHETHAVRVNKVKGSAFPVFGNLLSSLDRIALALDVPRASIQSTLLGSVQKPVAPVIVENAPVQQQCFEEGVLALLPVPTFFDKETGPYVSAGMMIACDPETGLGNASYARLKILSPTEALIGIAPNHHLAIMARKAADKGEALPFAVVLGAHPAIQLAACLYLGLGDDEMHCAGALLGEPVRMARCRNSDILVPAEAEIVIEGHIHANTPIVEGLVSEYHGMYEDYGSGVLATFESMSARKDAMFQVILPGYHAEHIYIAAVPIAVSLKAQLARVILNVGEVAVTASGCGRTNVVVQIDKPRPGQARRAMAICWGAVSIVKSVTIVDSDVDPWDINAVELAKSTRMRVDRDILIIPGMPADRSEPQEEAGMVAKIGYDATCKAGDRKEGYDKALPTEASYERMRRVIASSRPEGVV